MIDQVIIKKDGVYLDLVPPLSKGEDEGHVKITGKDCIYALRHSVVVENDVTFGDIIRMVHDSPELEEFIGLYNHCDAKRHNESILTPTDDRAKDIEWLEVSWTANFWGRNDLDLWTDCCGIGKEGSRSDGEREHYAIDLTPGNKLVDLPVRVNTNVELYLMSSDKIIGEGICHTKGGSPYIKTSRFISFLDFLDALYEEISFFGSDDRKTVVLEELREASEEFEAQLENREVLPWRENEDGFKIYLSDQVRGVLGLPTNEEDRDQQIAESSMLDEFSDTDVNF